LLGDILHNTIDGMAIAASFFFSPELGFSTTVAIIAHEIPKEAANFGVLLHAGFTVPKALFFNCLTALSAFVGALFIIILQHSITDLKYFLVPFTAGSFIYIAGTDLLPELHRGCSVKETFRHALWLAAGMGIMIGLSFITGVHHH
jgi:zinc and cadmium transporter